MVKVGYYWTVFYCGDVINVVLAFWSLCVCVKSSIATFQRKTIEEYILYKVILALEFVEENLKNQRCDHPNESFVQQYDLPVVLCYIIYNYAADPLCSLKEKFDQNVGYFCTKSVSLFFFSGTTVKTRLRVDLCEILLN